MSIANPQSMNRYAYVSNDPVNAIDPSGLNMQVCITYGWFPTDGHGHATGPQIGPDVQICFTIGGGGGGGGYSDGGGFLGGGSGGAQGGQQDNRSTCERMADDAQRVADATRNQYPKATPSWLLQQFNEVYGRRTYGTAVGEGPIGTISTLTGAVSAYVEGVTDYGTRNYRGQDGFPIRFQDGNSSNTRADQVHHFGYHFSAGLAGGFFNQAASKLYNVTDNRGDRNLGGQAYNLGAYLRANPGQLSRVGQLIKDTICQGKSIPR